jgi:DNA-binding MarR family transcriptional regulator
MNSDPPSCFPVSATLAVRDRCLCLHLQRAARAAARRFDTAFAPLNLTNGQFSLLASINRPEPPRISDIASVLAMDRSTVTAALKPLERRGLVISAPDPADLRGRRISLTDEGRALMARALPVWWAEHDLMDAELPGVDIDALRAALDLLAGRGGPGVT